MSSRNTKQGCKYFERDITLMRVAESDGRIVRLIALLENADLRLPCLVEQLATTLKLSVPRLRHLFRENVGIALGAYVKLVRLNKARNLLQNSNLSVKEVTAAVGCNDVSHFVRDYKRLFGETPSQSRRHVVRQLS